MDAHNARFAHQNKHVKGITGSHKKQNIRSQEWPTKSKEDPQERSATSQGNHGAEILNHNFVPKIQSLMWTFWDNHLKPGKNAHLELLSYFRVRTNWPSSLVVHPSHNGDELILKNKAFSSKQNAMEKEKVGCHGWRRVSSNFNPYMQRALFFWGWQRRK
jgi:hypothetical protein